MPPLGAPSSTRSGAEGLHRLLRPLCLALALCLPAAASAQCSQDDNAPCPLPLIALPPALGVRVQGSAVAGTAAFSFGVYSGPRTGRSTPPWLLSADVGVAWVFPETVEPWARLGVSRLWRLTSALELGGGASVLLPAFDPSRFAGGPSVLVQLRLGPTLLRLSGNVEVGLQEPAWSLALALIPW